MARAGEVEGCEGDRELGRQGPGFLTAARELANHPCRFCYQQPSG
jgi:hypothetical protein